MTENIMKCQDCKKEFNKNDYPEEDRHILDGLLSNGIEICHNCLVKRIEQAEKNYIELQKRASEKYKELKKCLICGKTLWITEHGIKFCKDCNQFYTDLELITSEIEEKVCSIIPSYENSCDDLCPIGYTDCPLTNWNEDYDLENLDEEDIKNAKLVD